MSDHENTVWELCSQIGAPPNGVYAAMIRNALRKCEADTIRRCADACDEQEQEFLSPEYAAGQPLSSFNERFACGDQWRNDAENAASDAMDRIEAAEAKVAEQAGEIEMLKHKKAGECDEGLCRSFGAERDRLILEICGYPDHPMMVITADEAVKALQSERASDNGTIDRMVAAESERDRWQANYHLAYENEGKFRRLLTETAVPALEWLHKDLMIRAEVDGNEKIVPCGASAWVKLCDALSAIRAQMEGGNG